MATYGISYMGSKNSIAPDLCKYMLYRHPDKTYFIDCCCGGFAMTDYILTHTENMKVIANDFDKDLIGFYNYFFASKENRDKLLNMPYIDRETYFKLMPIAKNELKILLVCCYTFGNQNTNDGAYLYGKEIELQKELLDNLCVYGDESHISQYFKDNEDRCKEDLDNIRLWYNNLSEDIKTAPIFKKHNLMMQQLKHRFIRIERLQRLAQLERLSRLELYNCDCVDLLNSLPDEIINNAIIYFDPPYINTATYKCGDDSLNNHILKWCLKNKNHCPCYISEYTLYDGMQRCYYMKKLSLLNNSTATKKHKIELLMYNGYEDVNECLGDQLQLWTN